MECKPAINSKTTGLIMSGGQKDLAATASNSQNCEDLPRVELDVVELSNEDSCHALEDGSSVHVHRGPDGKDKPADPFVNAVVLLDALDH